MGEDVKSRRTYRSPARAAGAARTRLRIIEAARALFLERGFSDTTIATIAKQAGVAPETVYSIYRTKAGLLDAIVRGAVLREDEPEDNLERSWVKHLLRQPDLPTRVTGFARHTAQTTELTSPIYAIIASAGTGEDEVDALQSSLLEMRFAGQREIMIALAQGESLRPASHPNKQQTPSPRSPAPNSTTCSRSSAAGRSSATRDGSSKRSRPRCSQTPHPAPQPKDSSVATPFERRPPGAQTPISHR